MNLGKLVGLAATMLLLSGCGEATELGSTGTQDRLLVRGQETDEALYAKVSGQLAVNERGCFTLDGQVLVVGKGSTVDPSGESISIADVGDVGVGENTSGSGGYFEGTDEVQRFAEYAELGPDAMECQTDPASPALVLLDPAGPR